MEFLYYNAFQKIWGGFSPPSPPPPYLHPCVEVLTGMLLDVWSSDLLVECYYPLSLSLTLAHPHSPSLTLSFTLQVGWLYIQQHQ